MKISAKRLDFFNKRLYFMRVKHRVFHPKNTYVIRAAIQEYIDVAEDYNMCLFCSNKYSCKKHSKYCKIFTKFNMTKLKELLCLNNN